MRSVLKFLREPLLLFLFFSFIAATILAPLALNYIIPKSADLLNHISNIIQAKAALTEGQFPLRDVFTDPNGWRYPTFQFYSTTCYTICALIYKFITPENPYIAYKITLWAALVIGGIYMYRLGFWLSHSKHAAILGGVIYLTSPYYLICINHLCDFTESIALGLLPAVLFYTFKGYAHFQLKNIFLIGLSWYLLITTHLITFIYSSFLISILFFLITLKNPHQVKNLINIIFGYTLGCLLALWYLAPIVFLSKYFVINDTFSLFAQRHPPFLGLFSINANYLRPAIGNTHIISGINPAVGWPMLFAAGICLHNFINKQFQVIKKRDAWVPFFLITFIIAFFMTWSPFDFWQWLPHFLVVGQYPWRFLSQISWIGALLACWAICIMSENVLDIRHVVIGTILIFIVSSSWLPINNKTSIYLNDFLKKPQTVFNNESYLLNFNKNSDLVKSINSYFLSGLVRNSILQVDKTVMIPRSIISHSFMPTIILTAEVPKASEKKQTLITFINGKIVAKHPLTPGIFTQRIFLNKIIDTSISQKNIEIGFEIEKINESKSILNIAVKDIILTGFFDKNEILTADQTLKYCNNVKGETVCKLFIPTSIKQVELPVYFYPKLLTITLNGKSIPYSSMLEKEHAFVTIKPAPGKENIIQIKFSGWFIANKISEMTWIICLFFTFYFVAKYIFKKVIINER